MEIKSNVPLPTPLHADSSNLSSQIFKIKCFKSRGLLRKKSLWLVEIQIKDSNEQMRASFLKIITFKLAAKEAKNQPTNQKKRSNQKAITLTFIFK
jgi:hypothetical protein